MKSRSGFTIVELLIVIVVIAILAAISIVAFNGIQERSRNTARLTAAGNIYKQLELYTQQTGSAVGNAGSPACIPTDANFDAGNGGLPDCQISGSVLSEHATATANLKNAGFSNFSYPATPVQNGATTYRGIVITYFAHTTQGMNGTLRPYTLGFVLEGNNQDCGPNSVRSDGAKVASGDLLNSIVPARNYATTPTSTTCMLSLTHYAAI